MGRERAIGEARSRAIFRKRCIACIYKAYKVTCFAQPRIVGAGMRVKCRLTSLQPSNSNELCHPSHPLRRTSKTYIETPSKTAF
jgi:hypothetical protein